MVRLLLVEDDADLAALLTVVLQRAGHEVATVARVADVVPAAVDVDAVISDGVLLDGTIEHVLDALAHDPRTAALPVIVCALRPDAIAHPAVVAKLRKPLDVGRFVAAVEEALAADRAPAEVAVPTAADDSGAQQALQELDRRGGIIADAGAAAILGDLTHADRRDAERAAHQAVGLAGALGHADLAGAAGEAEGLLRAGVPLSRDQAARLCELAAVIEDGARRPATRTAAPAVARRAPLASRGRVAVVDDDVALTDLLTPRLHAAGLQVSTHANGREALQHLTGPEGHADVIVLDVDLPGINGLSVLAGLHLAGVLATTQVVLSTVHDNEAELARAFATGVVTHVPKPFELERVVDLVAELAAS